MRERDQLVSRQHRILIAGPRADAEGLRCLHELAALQRQRLATHDARHVEPFDGADGDEDEHEVTAEIDDEQDDEEDEEEQAEDLLEADAHPWSPPSSAARPMLPRILVSDWMFWSE
mgnify:CR=1 FL=1